MSFLFSTRLHALLVGRGIEHFLAFLLAVAVLHLSHDFPAFSFVVFTDWHITLSVFQVVVLGFRFLQVVWEAIVQKQKIQPE